MSSIPTNLIVFDSRDRTSGTVQNATYNTINVNGLEGTYEFLGYSSVNQVYNVEVGVNDTIYFDEDATQYAVVIPPGSYTSTTFNAAAKVVMEIAAGGTYTFTVSPATGVVTVVLTVASTFNWEFGTQILNGDLANSLLGLSAVDTAPNPTQVGDLVPDMRLHTHIILRMNEDGSRNVDLLDGTEYSLVIPLETSYGQDINTRKGNLYSQTLQFVSNITNLTILQYDEDGVPLVNNPEYVLTIRKLFD